MNLKHRLDKLEAAPNLLLARLLPELRRLEGQPRPRRVAWLRSRTDAELEAIASSGPGNLDGLTDAQLERIATAEGPEAVLGADQARARGFVACRVLDVRIEREIDRVTASGGDAAAIERDFRETYNG